MEEVETALKNSDLRRFDLVIYTGPDLDYGGHVPSGEAGHIGDVSPERELLVHFPRLGLAKWIHSKFLRRGLDSNLVPAIDA